MSLVRAVVIGRNEGDRLRRCLESVRRCGVEGVYVDSGSTDRSLATATSIGFAAITLDPHAPFTAARARHEGYCYLLSKWPDTEYVVFLDGDCELSMAWPAVASEFLDTHQNVGIVAGRRRELYPMRSLYNQLCDIEWDTPVGEAASVGGDSVARVAAYQASGGFNMAIPAGEEPELCARIRAAGWTIYRLDTEMTLHDAAITSFAQWWRRMVRTGYGSWNVGREHRIREFRKIVRSAFVWGGIVPLTAALIALASLLLGNKALIYIVLFTLMALILLQSLRIAARTRSPERSVKLCLLHGLFGMLAKVPIVTGVLIAIWRSKRQRPMTIIEYKASPS